MKIDNMSVDRMDRINATDTATQRQGSRQVEPVQPQNNQQNRTEPSVQDDVKNRLKEQDRDRGKSQEDMMKELKEAIDQANKSFKPMNRRFEYSVHDVLPRVSVKVIDSTSDKVIREIPSEKLMDMVANMLEVAGIIVDERG